MIAISTQIKSETREVAFGMYSYYNMINTSGFSNNSKKWLSSNTVCTQASISVVEDSRKVFIMGLDTKNPLTV